MSQKLIYIFLLMSALSSCQPGSDDNKSAAPVAENVVVSKHLTRQGRIDASCQFTYDQGEKAPDQLPTAKIKTSLFSKQFNSALLDSVLNSSGKETQKFVEIAGSKIYQIENDDLDSLGCLFLNALEKAPASLEKKFRSAEEPDPDEKESGKKSMLLGIYLDKEKVQEIMGTPAEMKPVILIKKDTERYTMVHEFMHHIFNLQKNISGTQLQKNGNKINKEFSDAIKSYNSTHSEADFKQVVNLFIRLSDVGLAILREYTLEEMSIEHELSQRYVNGSFRYISQFARLNGDYYIYGSGENAKKELKENMKDFVDQIKPMLPQWSQETQSSVNSQLAVLMQKVTQMESEITAAQAQAAARLNQFVKDNPDQKILRSGLLSSDEVELHDVGCSHSHAELEYFKNLKKIMKQFN